MGSSVRVEALTLVGSMNVEQSGLVVWPLVPVQVLQPIVHVKDKRKIGVWIPHVPPFARNKDWYRRCYSNPGHSAFD